MAIKNLDICLTNTNLVDNTKMEVQNDFFHTSKSIAKSHYHDNR